jgi:hypothetical protein
LCPLPPRVPAPDDPGGTSGIRRSYPRAPASGSPGGTVHCRGFYTSLGHREDVWTNPLFQRIMLGGMNWAAGNVDAKVEPNLKEACPGVEHVWEG